MVCRLMVFAVCALFAGRAMAQLNLGPLKDKVGKHKYGVIDMQTVILNVEEGKAARASLEKEIKAKEAGFQKQKIELDKLNEEWKNQSAILSPEARTKKQEEFQTKFLALRNAEGEFQNDIKRKEQKATQAIAMKIAGLIDRLAKELKLEVVFEANNSGLVYLDNPLDLTQQVAAIYGKEGGKAAAPAKE
jgi:outer membrane protein